MDFFFFSYEANCKEMLQKVMRDPEYNLDLFLE